MYKTISSIVLYLLLLPGVIYCGGLNKTKFFGIVGFGFSIAAISADLGAEHYYGKYEKAMLPTDCSRYRDLTKICEKTRDVSFALAVVNFSVSTIFLLKEKKPELGVKVDYKRGKLCTSLVRLLY